VLLPPVYPPENLYPFPRVYLVDMADRPPVRSTRLKEGLDERFTDYRDERDMTNSEALRALVRFGLEQADEEPDDSDGDASEPAASESGFFEQVLPSAVASLFAATIVLAGLGAGKLPVLGVIGVAAAAALTIPLGVDRALDRAIAEMERSDRGVIGRGKTAYIEAHSGPTDPETFVEKIARTDLFAPVFLAFTFTGVVILFLFPAPIASTIGADGVRIMWWLIVLSTYMVASMLLLGLLGRFALSTAESTTDEPTLAEEAEEGA